MSKEGTRRVIDTLGSILKRRVDNDHERDELIDIMETYGEDSDRLKYGLCSYYALTLNVEIGEGFYPAELDWAAVCDDLTNVFIESECLPCPFCGYEEPSVPAHDSAWVLLGICKVSCPKCGCEGPVCSDRLKAVKVWSQNKRVTR